MSVMAIFQHLMQRLGAAHGFVSGLQKLEAAGLIMLIVALTLLYDWWKRN
jgi:hypothetical protein